MAIADGADLKAVVKATMTNGGQHINVFYWEADFDSEQSEATVVTHLTNRLDAIYTLIEDILEEDMVFDQYVFYKRSLTEWEWFGEGSPDITPAAVGTVLPDGVAAVMRMYTTRNKTIGRKYIGNLREEGWNGSSWSAAELTALGGFLVGWMQSFEVSTGIDYKAGVYSEVYGFKDATEVGVLNTIPGYQRRRKPGVGA